MECVIALQLEPRASLLLFDNLFLFTNALTDRALHTIDLLKPLNLFLCSRSHPITVLHQLPQQIAQIRPLPKTIQKVLPRKHGRSNGHHSPQWLIPRTNPIRQHAQHMTLRLRRSHLIHLKLLSVNPLLLHRLNRTRITHLARTRLKSCLERLHTCVTIVPESFDLHFCLLFNSF
jgi:hypothetical protein